MRGRVVAPVLLGMGLSLVMAVRPVRADFVHADADPDATADPRHPDQLRPGYGVAGRSDRFRFNSLMRRPQSQHGDHAGGDARPFSFRSS